MLVDQAFYGTVQNGHGLKCASGDRKIAQELANRLDLPDTAPPGANWSPYVSGFFHRDYYVLARTFSDPSSTRAGMVVSHALICRREEIIELSDLRPLFQKLVVGLDGIPTAVEAIEIIVDEQALPSAIDLVDAARSLVSRGIGPVVRIGTESFEDLIIALWSRLGPSLRKCLTFRLSFGPNDIVEQPAPALVCIPASLIGRWPQQRIVGRAGSSDTLASSMIEGSAKGAELIEFAADIGAELDSFEVLPLLEQAYFMASTSPATFARVLSAVRLIERLSPNPTNGIGGKASVVSRLVSLLPDVTPSDVLLLRNLATSALPTGRAIWEALANWVTRNPFAEADDNQIITILHEALIADEAIKSWSDAVISGLNAAIRQPGNAFQRGFWRWADADSSLCDPIIAIFQGHIREMESLISAIPRNISQDLASKLLATSLKMKSFKLYAATASTSMNPVDAAKALSQAEPGGNLDSMRLALSNARPEDLLVIADEVNDERVLLIASTTVAKTPSLLATADMTSATNRKIWTLALKENPESWRGPADPRRDFDKILIELMDGENPPSELLERLSETPLADLSSFSKRKELWPLVNGGTRTHLLRATADKWFEQAEHGQIETVIEAELQEKILGDMRLDQVLARLTRGQVGDGLRLIAALPGFDRSRYRSWVVNAIRSTNPIAMHDAEVIGQTASAHGQRDLVDDIISHYRAGRADLEPALRHSMDLIGFLDRWLLGLSPLTDAEKWNSFVQLATDLYPSGPDHLSLWDRAGGRNSDLVHYGAGLWRWQDAVKQMKNGKPPRVGHLIREMRKDYPNNQNLRHLAEDALFK